MTVQTNLTVTTKAHSEKLVRTTLAHPDTVRDFGFNWKASRGVRIAACSTASVGGSGVM